MRRRFQHLRRDERGMSLVFVGLGLTSFVAATALAIDVGMLMTARGQAQNSADAGAHAGAVALAFNDYDDRSPGGPAVQAAMSAAVGNQVMSGNISVTPDDVTFPPGPAGLNNRVKIIVRRTADRENPVQTLIARLFGVDEVDVTATATAEASPANAMTCVKPFIIPDRWRESNGQLATQNDTFEMYDNKGNLLANPDVYVPSGSGYTGYNNEADRGTLLTLRAGTGNNITPSFYYSLALNGETGGSTYEWNIANCNRSIMRRGDLVIQEPGNMMGPTVDGAQRLMARDPDAYWDTVKNTVVSNYNGQSPRVFPIPLYDPIYYEQGKQNGRYADLKVANWIGFFLEDVSGNEIYGRIMPIAGIVDSTSPTFDNAFPWAIRLVE